VQSGNAKLTETEILRLNSLPNASATALIENLAAKSGVKVTPQTADLLVQQFCGNPSAITSIFLSAQENRQDLDTFQKVQQIYVDSVLGSWAGRSCETLFDEVTPSLEIQKKIINLLANEERKTPLDTWRERLELPENEFRRIIKSLHVNLRVCCFFRLIFNFYTTVSGRVIVSKWSAKRGRWWSEIRWPRRSSVLQRR
jgi:hypothetical protein